MEDFSRLEQIGKILKEKGVYSEKITEILKRTDIGPFVGRCHTNFVQLVQTYDSEKKEFHFLRSDFLYNEDKKTEEDFIAAWESLSGGKLCYGVTDKGLPECLKSDFSEQVVDMLIDWFAAWIDTIFFIQACGYTAKNIMFRGKMINAIKDVSYGYNTPIAPSSNRIILPKGVKEEKELKNEGEHSISFELIQRAVREAKTAFPHIKPIRPIHVCGRNMYVMYLNPTQIFQLRCSREEWRKFVCDKPVDCFGEKTIFGKITDVDDGGYRGNVCVGVYENEVILCESIHVTNGVNSDNTRNGNVRRAVLLGAESVVVGFDTDCKFELKAKDKEEKVVHFHSILGMKKIRSTMKNISEQDCGTIVIPTYVGGYENMS
ncbi:phage capsid family protein [Bartonella sp. B30(2025)]